MTTVTRPAPRKSASRRRNQRNRTALVGIAIVVLATLGAVTAWLHTRSAPCCSTQSTVATLVGPEAASDAFKTVVKAASDAGATVLIGTLQGGGQSYTVVDTRPTGDDQLSREQSAADIAQELADAYAPLAAASSGPDVLDGLNHLGQQLVGSPHGSLNLLIDGNALNIGAGVNLADPVQRGDIAAVVAKVTARPLPDLQGARVYMVRASMTVGTPLDSLGDLQVQEIYRQVLQRAHATLVVWNDTQLPVYPSDATIGPVHFPVPVGSCDLTIRLGDSVLFDTDSSTLKPGAEPFLQELLTSLTVTHADATAAINGYTDSRGSAAHNQTLSQARAAAVAFWLERHGVPASRLNPTGHGATSFIGDNITAAGQALNRRVEIVLHLTTTCAKGY